jgi:hypothetical protein
MIYYMKAQLLLLISGLMFLTSCFNDEVFPTLPPETQEGLNTFGCLVDGVLLTPTDGQDGFGGQGASGINIYYYKDSLDAVRPPFLDIFARDYSSGTGPEYVYLYLPSLFEPARYEINHSKGNPGIDSPPHAHLYAGIWQSDKTFLKYLSLDNSGTADITRMDTINTIISGTFSATLVDEVTRLDTIWVTEGRFDIDWSLLD